MDALPITAYLDGRPGHDKQTLAVIRRLEHLTPVKVTRRLVSPHETAITKHLLTWPAVWWLGQGRQRASAGEAAELLIGSGRRTHPALLRDKWQRGTQAAAVCAMSPGNFWRAAFDLCLVPAHDRINRTRRRGQVDHGGQIEHSEHDGPGENIFITEGPPCLPINEHRHDPGRGLILVGGLDPKSHHWDSEEICRQVDSLLDRQPEKQWTISSSPRTPPATIDRLAALARQQARRATFYRAAETSSGWIEEQYRQNQEVWVSADSISMVYEALSAGCRVGVLPVRWKLTDNKFNWGLDNLRAQNLIVYYDQWQPAAPLPTPQVALNEAERCAREILRRWWPEIPTL